MKYVLDASVALKWVLAETDSAVALKLRSDFEQQIHELIAPDVLPAECGHGLTRAERKRVIAAGESMLHLADILTTLPKLFSSVPLILRAAEIAVQMRTSLYDCLYVALAERENCEFLTADEKLSRVLMGYPITLLSAL